MAKSKNHTNHNQNYKDHRHPIRLKGRRNQISSKGLEQKLKKNRKKSRKGFLTPDVQKEIREKRSKKGEARRLKSYEKFKAKLPIWKAKHKAAVKAEKEQGIPDPKKASKQKEAAVKK
uniref:60S ribosomal protein L29 n=1 Tax=Euglena gracilis TaxID=3039 RepID=A0A7L5NVL0_EUGGR|nr:60S large subunit ribosomal protein eL29 variant 2 [Euglena gracilis]